MISKCWYIGTIIIVFSLVSCGKGDIGDCFKTAGKKTMEQRDLTPFHYVKLYDNVNLVIEQGNETNCLVETGENLIKGLTTVVNEQGVLEIRNTNDCNWVRSFDQPLTVYLRLQRLDTLEYMSIGDVSTIDTLYQDKLVVNLFEGAGKIDLVIHSQEAHIGLHYGTQELKVSGFCELVYAYSASFGVVDTRDLYTSILYMSTLSSNHMYVRSSGLLVATIKGLGNVYYYGDPIDISFNKEGQGDLIHVTP